ADPLQAAAGAGAGARAGGQGVSRFGLDWGTRIEGISRVAGWWTAWLGFVFFFALLAILLQLEALIGPQGILPARDLLTAARAALPWSDRVGQFPTLYWLGTSAGVLHGVTLAGLAAAVAVMARWHARVGVAVCLAAFLSFLAVAQVFASYQSDGMLMTAGFIALFLDARRPSAWSWFSLRWLWFTIYFGSGMAKLLSGDPEWRHLTALDHYYENGPLPTWLGWYAQQHLPHFAEAGLALATLGLELGLAWLCFGPRRARITLFWIATPFQLGLILTANYGFLNWLVLGLGLSLLDDRHVNWILRRERETGAPHAVMADWRTKAASAPLIALVLLTGGNLMQRLWTGFPAPQAVNRGLEPFRVTDPFGLFAVMTRARYEIEFQGSPDGVHWTAYPFRFKPQDPHRAPGMYGPYQPRFDWNLWFASLASYQQDPWVEQVELRLLANDKAVTGLFAGNPFATRAPRAVRAVLWQYWFSTPTQKHAEGIWWTRKLLGLYAPVLVMTPNGPAQMPLS
ncbi:MAG: lipase maturation factor family protein, partial [Terriglobales bacterium]